MGMSNRRFGMPLFTLIYTVAILFFKAHFLWWAMLGTLFLDWVFCTPLYQVHEHDDEHEHEEIPMDAAKELKSRQEDKRLVS